MKPSDLNYQFSKRLALTIMVETGQEIPEESEPWVLPIESEYKRIQAKESKLSSRNRKDLSAAYESLLNIKKEEAERLKDTEKTEE
jgi:hypothetical protein